MIPERAARVVSSITSSHSNVIENSITDWTRLISIVDPTNYTGHGSGFKVNCYTKRHKEWLPHPEEGEILILRNVKVSVYKKINYESLNFSS